MKNGYSAYQTTTIETADQGKLILIAYDVAIKHCRLAIELMGTGADPADRNKHLYKAQDAITELMSALRLDVGEIARNLYRLYEYMIFNLVQSVIKNNDTGAQEALRHLLTLREAWEVAVKTVKTANAGPVVTTPSRTFAMKG